MKNLRLFPVLGVVAVLAMIGCDASAPVARFEPNYVHTMKYQISQEISMDQASVDSTWVVDKMFGTPDDPKLPAAVSEDDELSDVVSIDHLTAASGSPTEAGRGLYRTHCANCHGVTGNGRGSLASVQTVYPRDYRMGVFKFKSTPRGVKPTKDDIANLVKHGIGGTTMVPIPQLTEDDIKALTDYVIYLSMRGEMERAVVDGAIMDGILEDGDRLLDSDFAARISTDPEMQDRFDRLAEKENLSEDEQAELDAYEAYQENWEYAEDYVAEIAASWVEADDAVIEAATPPTDMPIAETYADVVKFREGEQAEVFLASIERGRELFTGKTAACSTCHGIAGKGDGQTTDYDDWTKDYTTRVNIDPKDRETLIPLMARGAMEPKNILPRAFDSGVFRGGSSGPDLYRRITQGIDGTPMPAATFIEGEFEERDVWHIINFIRSLQSPPETTEETPAEDETLAMAG